MARPKRLVRWSQWDGAELVMVGQLYMDQIKKQLAAYEARAKQVVERSGFDYIVYGLKVYNPNSDLTELVEVRFCSIGMSNEEYKTYVEERPNMVVLAAHKKMYKGKVRGRKKKKYARIPPKK